MLDGCKTFRDFRTAIPLTALKISALCTIHCDFYGYPNTQNRMYELCTISQIQSQMVTTAFLLLHICSYTIELCSLSQYVIFYR